jgi:hypothetical protein
METKDLDIYGSEPIPWTRAHEALAGSRGPGAAFFLGTVGPDATPHAAGIGAVWADGTLWFVTGPRTRKARNLTANPACTTSCRLPRIERRATAVASIPRHVAHRVRRRDRGAVRGFALAVRYLA